jgi:type II secretory pathway pseudopilin PulG
VSETVAPRKGIPLWGKVLIGCGIATLVGVALLAVLVVLGVNSLRKRRGKAMEVVAVANLRNVAAAQEQYRLMKNAYAAKVSALSDEAMTGGAQMNLIPPGLTSGTHAGYVFREMKSIGGKPIVPARQYAVCASPTEAVEGGRGKRTFIMASDGVIWAKERAQGAGALEDFPADPAADGWQQVP